MVDRSRPPAVTKRAIVGAAFLIAVSDLWAGRCDLHNQLESSFAVAAVGQAYWLVDLVRTRLSAFFPAFIAVPRVG
jgi:hypothetical protein